MWETILLAIKDHEAHICGNKEPFCKGRVRTARLHEGVVELTIEIPVTLKTHRDRCLRFITGLAECALIDGTKLRIEGHELYSSSLEVGISAQNAKQLSALGIYHNNNSQRAWKPKILYAELENMTPVYKNGGRIHRVSITKVRSYPDGFRFNTRRIRDTRLDRHDLTDIPVGQDLLVALREDNALVMRNLKGEVVVQETHERTGNVEWAFVFDENSGYHE